MAVADVPGLMDIASTLAQDEIPFKLRCAICNNLAVNAFRLPCCDQSICESCQTSLSDTCPVCTHTPVSPDLCKPNKALRTTLKAFLRTEEKKREKDRQSAATPNDTPAVTTAPAVLVSQNGDPTPAGDAKVPPLAESTESKREVPEVDAPAVDFAVPHTAESAPESNFSNTADAVATADAGDQPVQPGANGIEPNNTETTLEAAAENLAEPPVNGESTPGQDPSNGPISNTAPNASGNFPPMGWNGNTTATNPYMAGMFNFPNSMVMPMGMDPMANQGMLGDYGMNMTGMGMNSGMNYNGNMYGSLGWDASQNNMWQGGQDNFNPNAFANGTGPPYGRAFGGSNMSAYPSSDYQSGYYGQGYGRGGFRGRGRGQYHGPGRGGFGPMNGHYRANSAYSNQNPNPVAEGANPVNAQGNSTNFPESNENGMSGDHPGTDNQLQGIPTIDSLQPVSSVSNGASPYYIPGPGVEGAPAAPRAMRQGLPNTSVFRQRGFQIQGRVNNQGEQPDAANIKGHTQSRSRSRSPSHHISRPCSPSVRGTDDGRDSQREIEPKRMDRVDEVQSDARRTPSPSRTSSRRSSRRRHQDIDWDRDRKDTHRSQRSRRHRSHSRGSSRTGESRPSGRLNAIPENNSNGRAKIPSEAPESRDLASRISSSRRSDKDRGSRREEDRSRGQDRDTRRRDRDRDRDGRDRGRDTDRERRRDDRDRDRHAERDRDRRDRPRERERDRKRSRRDRSPSANGSDHPNARRVKRVEDRSRGQSNGTSTKKSEPEKDPYTLEREARNKERLEREKQHREKAKSGGRRDSRQDRVVAGRRINYKYEDEL